MVRRLQRVLAELVPPHRVVPVDVDEAKKLDEQRGKERLAVGARLAAALGGGPRGPGSRSSSSTMCTNWTIVTLPAEAPKAAHARLHLAFVEQSHDR